MSYAMEYPITVAEATSEARVAFIRRTYAHLTGAVIAFAALSAVLLQLPGIDGVLQTVLGGRFSWLLVMGGFMAVSYVAERWAQSDTSRGMQYMGLGLYVVAQALIFLPLLYIADRFFPNEQVIGKAALITVITFAGLTMATLMSGKDFSFLRTALITGSWLAMGLIVASIFMGWSLGLWFSFAMVAFACGAILYHTSNVMHHYRTDQYVAASLSLFASVALLFWYVLQIVMWRRN